MTQARVLLTGSSGLLGAAVAARLVEAGHAVLGLDPAPPAGTARHPHLPEDLADEARLRRVLGEFAPTHVIHAGGVSGPMVLADDPAGIMDINVRRSLTLLFGSLAAGVERFVYCSSLSAIGDTGSGLLPDDPPMVPTTAYGASKAAMDCVLRGLHGRVPMRLRSLRFTALYGAARRTAIPLQDVVNAARDGGVARVPDEPAWPYIHCDDAAVATIAAAFAPPAPQLFYTIAHPEMVTLREVAALLASLGAPVRIEVGRDLPTGRRGPLDVSAASRDLGFTAAIDMREGLRRIVASWGDRA